MWEGMLHVVIIAMLKAALQQLHLGTMVQESAGRVYAVIGVPITAYTKHMASSA